MMKTRYCLTIGALLATTGLVAQNTYMNEHLTTVSDVTGTARYVGMGGALGALGADISVMSANPAGIGLFRSSDISGSFSVLTQADKSAPDGKFTRASLDQMGFVLSNHFNGKRLKYLNFGLNYQRKANFGHTMIADNGHTGGLSQTDQLALLTNSWGGWNDADKLTLPCDLAAVAYDASLILSDQNHVFHGQPSQANQFSRQAQGGLDGFDFNMSMNFNDRIYFGATLGVDYVDYYATSFYTELYEEKGNFFDYNTYNTQAVNGYGINGKFGVIVRPFAYSAFRIGFTIETPTFYTLESTASVAVDSHYDKDGVYVADKLYTYYGPDDNYVDYTLVSPWKFRLSMGHTIDNFLAFGAEYEYVNYHKTRMGYIDYGSWGGRMEDQAMNSHTRNTLRGGHNFKIGMESRITDSFFLRVGYNYYSEAYEQNAHLNQNIDSYALGYSVATDYMNKKEVNLVTFGLGYRVRHFYADLAYKYRMQHADFYAFDDSFIFDENYKGPQVRLSSVDVNLDRHQVAFTLGYKF